MAVQPGVAPRRAALPIGWRGCEPLTHAVTLTESLYAYNIRPVARRTYTYEVITSIDWLTRTEIECHRITSDRGEIWMARMAWQRPDPTASRWARSHAGGRLLPRVVGPAWQVERDLALSGSRTTVRFMGAASQRRADDDKGRARRGPTVEVLGPAAGFLLRRLPSTGLPSPLSEREREKESCAPIPLGAPVLPMK